MIKHMDIPYKQINDITLYLDLYMPENEMNPPLIMWIHGGAWMYGDRKSPSSNIFMSFSDNRALNCLQKSSDAILSSKVLDLSSIS